MPLDLQIIRAREFVRMGGEGQLDLAASRAALTQLATALRRRGIDRALLDVRELRTTLSPQDLGALVQMFREIGFSRGHRLALLYSGDALGRTRLFAFISILRGQCELSGAMKRRSIGSL